jgi:nucleoside-diphosphate-sugar epimerase
MSYFQSEKNILIVGNLGYIGAVLTPYLKKKSFPYKLIGLDNAYFSGCLINPFHTTDYLLDHQIYLDVRHLNINNMPKVDTVIYLAAISNDPMGNIYEIPTYDINENFAVRCSQLAKEVGAKSFVFASSCSVYGAGGDSAKKETDSLNPLTAYAKSKIGAEEKLKAIADENFVITCLRFATACGGSPRLRLDLVLNDFVASALLKKKIEILSDGMPFRPLIDVEDMCKAIHWAQNRTKENGGHFLALNIGFEDWNFRIKDLAYAVSQEIKDTSVEINSNAAPDKRSYKVDFSLYKALAPENQNSKTLTTTILEILNTIKKSSFRNQDFRNSHLFRLNTLTQLRESKAIDSLLYWTQ